VSEYYITPQEEPKWRFDPHDFVRRVQGQWPDARTGVNEDPDSPMTAEALIPFPPPQRELGVALSKLGYAIYLDPADPDTTAEFAAWYLTQLPDLEPEVYLFTSNYDVNMPLRFGTSAADIQSFLESRR
jgi:hypothetical protein